MGLVLSGQTVNQKFHLQILKFLRLHVRHMKPDLFPDKWIILHDLSSCIVLYVKEFLWTELIMFLAGLPELDFRQGQDFSLLCSVQTSSGSHILVSSGYWGSLSLG
jgi:hypothetical protein